MTVDTQIEPTEGWPSSDEALLPMDAVVEAALMENRQEFVRFLVRRLGDVSTAEDVFQSFCERAISKRFKLRKSQSAIPWLYAVLRSVLIDYYRSEAARRRRDAGYAQELILQGDAIDEPELHEVVCGCFERLLKALRPEYSEVLRRADLLEETRERIADDLGITSGNVRVRLHRARQALRAALGRSCGDCCEHGFRDCTCNQTQSHDC